MLGPRLKQLLFLGITTIAVFQVLIAFGSPPSRPLALHVLFPWLLVFGLYRMPPARFFTGRLMILGSILLLGLAILVPSLFLYCVLGAPLLFYLIYRHHQILVSLVMATTPEKEKALWVIETRAQPNEAGGL